jgi:hypothetical protein
MTDEDAGMTVVFVASAVIQITGMRHLWKERACRHALSPLFFTARGTPEWFSFSFA